MAKKFVPSRKSLSSLGFEERNLGCPGNFAGMFPGPLGVFKKFVQKKFVRIFRSLFQSVSNRRFANRRFSQLNDKKCWHVRERSQTRCDRSFCRSSYKTQCLANGLVATFGWRALTDVPTSLVIQSRKPPVSKPLVRQPDFFSRELCRKAHVAGANLKGGQ